MISSVLDLSVEEKRGGLVGGVDLIGGLERCIGTGALRGVMGMSDLGLFFRGGKGFN